MKFIHIADVHWGAQPEKDRSFGRIRENEIKLTFQKVIDYANKQQTDVLLIAGDFFDQRPTKQELREVDYILSGLQNTKTVMIAGNHDHLSTEEEFVKYHWNSEVYLLDGRERNYVYFEELHTTIYGISYWTNQIREAVYDDMKPQDYDEFSILLAHGGDESHIPINKDILKWSGFDYIALGHIHKPEIIFEDLMAYSGSLEPLDRTETGSHGFIEGEISEEKQQIEFVPFAKRMYIQVEVMITEEMSASEIKDRIETELSYRGKDNIYEVVLTGSIDSEIEIDFDDIKEDYLISDIIYETKSRWDYDQLAEENDLMIQKVAEILKEEPQALTFAMEALSYARERKVMEIEKINIDGFGKFHKYNALTTDKIQVFFGKNEAGKTTIRKFMISMLFGLERARGVAAENDDYIRYMPVNGGNYGGSVTIRKGKTFYRIIRNFSKEQKNLRMFYEDTMEEINLPGTTLQRILFDSDKTAFENTVSMTQADIRTGKEMKEVLQNSMANLRSSKNAGIDLRKAVDYLKIKRRQKRKDSAFVQVDILRKQKNEFKYDVGQLRRYEQEEREIKRQLQQKRHLTFWQKLIGWIQKLLGNDPEKIRKMELKHRLEIIEIEKSQLQMQEQKAEDMEYKYQQALSRKKAAELEIHEIEQAIKAIEQAGRSIQKTFGQELNEKISKIFSDVTNGKYTKVVMDDSLRMMVYDGFDYIDMKYLSNATIEQLYFALRLASADLLYEDDGFPLFLDDVFGNYDDERLKQTLGYLERKTDRQIFLFTGRKEILHVLDQNEISYHLISL